MSRSGTRYGKQRILFTLETTSMFKKLIPVVALALLAGPVLAADPPASSPSADQSSSSTSKSHHSKKHKKSTSTAPAKSTGDTSSAPAK